MLFSHWAGKVSVRIQRYRLDATGKLFDLQADPGQNRDIAHEQPNIAARLSAAVTQWSTELLADLKTDDRPFTVGYSEFPSPNFPLAMACPTALSAGVPALPTVPSFRIGPVPKTASPGTFQ